MPANDDLRRGFAVFIRQVADDFLIEHAFTALRQRAPGLGLDLVGSVPGVKLALLHQRVQLDLVNHRCDARFVNQTLQVMHLEVTDADAFHQPLFLQVNHPFPGVNIVIDSRNRPVHQVQIDEIELEFLQALLQRFAGALLIVVPQFSGDEQFIAGDAGAGQCGPHAVLVFVRGGGINRPIADFQGFMNGGDDLVVTGFPYT